MITYRAVCLNTPSTEGSATQSFGHDLLCVKRQITLVCTSFSQASSCAHADSCTSKFLPYSPTAWKLSPTVIVQRVIDQRVIDLLFGMQAPL